MPERFHTFHSESQIKMIFNMEASALKNKRLEIGEKEPTETEVTPVHE